LLLKHQKETTLEKPVYEKADKYVRRGNGRGDRREKQYKQSTQSVTRMETYKILVGYSHGVKAGNIVGAIANEGGLDSKHIGRIEIFEDFSTVDLPGGIPQDTLNLLGKIVVSGQRLNISEFNKKRSSKSRSHVRIKRKKTKTTSKERRKGKNKSRSKD
jgi:ATP-dependent RNA helicase DeaD